MSCKFRRPRVVKEHAAAIYRFRGKVMSRKTNKLQAPVLEYFIYSRHPHLQKSRNSCEKLINSCKHKKVPKKREIKPKHILRQKCEITATLKKLLL